MKWRNQMLALFCLFVFLAFGVFYFKYWVIQKPFGIILFVGEGLDARQLAAARIVAGGPEKPLAIESLRFAALLKNYSSDSATPDAAAAATALATGVKVNNGSIAIDVDGEELTNLFQLAHGTGRMTGLVTNGSVTSPTAASFYAHAASVDNPHEVARQLAGKAHLDLVLGGGLADFLPESHGGHRTDDRDLLEKLGASGYEVVHSLGELEEVPRWRRAKLFGLFADAELPFADELAPQDDQPTLADMVRRGIELLQYHRGGYLLVVDVALMRKAAAGNDPQRRAAETLAAISGGLNYLAHEDFYHDDRHLFLLLDEKLISLSEGGQYVDKEVIKEGLKQLEYGRDGFTDAFFPKVRGEVQTTFAINPKVNFGKLSIVRLGVGAEAIGDRFDAGESVSDIARDFGATGSEVEEALRWHVRLAA